MTECGELQYFSYVLLILLLISVYFNMKNKRAAKKRQENDLLLIKKAYFDPVTELPNKRNIEIVLSEQIARTSRHKKSFLVAAIKVTNYTHVNEASTQRGAEFIAEVGDRLLGSIRNEDMLSRISDNEFIIVFNEYLEETNFNVIVNRINTKLKEKFQDDNGELDIKIKIGESKYPDDATEPQELINKAILKALN